MKNVEFMTGKEKEMVLKQWNTFINNRCQLKNFTKRIYDHLHLHCSFIAHYDLRGFYGTYFENPHNTIKFLTRFNRNKGNTSIELGMTYWMRGDYQDLNEAMCAVVEKIYDDYIDHLTNTERENDIGEAARLLAKHGLEQIPYDR